MLFRSEPEPEVPDRLIVVDTEVFEAEVTRPYVSIVRTGILVEPPYTPEVTPDTGNLAEFKVPEVIFVALVVSVVAEDDNPETALEDIPIAVFVIEVILPKESTTTTGK